jgi:hypothetical protein
VIFIVISSAVVWFLLAAVPARSDEVCPKYPLGVTSQASGGDETFYASAFVRPFGDDEASLLDAQREARIAARSLLRRDKRVPLGANGRLVGAKDEGSCIADGRTYYSVSINAKSAAQAIALDEQLRKSLASKPAPQIPSFSWIGSSDENAATKEIERLLKP